MTDKISCVIVEDDPVSQAVIEELAERTGFLQVEQSFRDPLQAVKWLSSNHTDLLLLDIEMPGLSGLELLETLLHKPQVIIISSKQQYAIEAIDYDVIAYLVKPIDNFSKFLKAAIKAKNKIDMLSVQPASRESIYIKADSMFTHLPINEILWCEAFGDFVKINTDKKIFTVYNTMKAVEKNLPTGTFIRVHRSYIVNINKIINIDSTNLEISRKIIPIGNSYRENLMRRITTL